MCAVRALTLSSLLAFASAVAGAGQVEQPFHGDGMVAFRSFDSDRPPGDQDVAASVALVPGPFGRAAALLAPGARLTGPDAGFPNGREPGSLSVWFCAPAGTGDQVLVSYGSPKVGQARGLWLVNANRLCFFFHAHPRDLHVDIAGQIAPDRWHHVAAVYDGRKAMLYFDGRLAGQVDVELDTGLPGAWQIGANLRPDHRDYRGLIDEVAVLNRAISAAEIAEYYAAGRAKLERLPPGQSPTYAAVLEYRDRKLKESLGRVVTRLGFEKVVFAVRPPGKDGHWYANFSHWADNPERTLYGDGGRLCVLDLKDGTVRTLWDDPRGGVRDPQVHYDGRKILFSFRAGGQPYYRLAEINADGTGLRQLTDGPFDDFEPAYLPDGGIAFVSSRTNCYVPCYYTRVAVLHRCDGDGANIRRLSANVEQENTPWVLPDGRILYQRWEYVDRSQLGFHHLWTANPDGTGQMVYYGNTHPGGVFIDAKPIPGTHAVVMIHSPGHGRTEHAGFVERVEPDRGPHDLQAARRLTAQPDWRDPYPLSDDAFLVAGPGGTQISLLDSRGTHVPLYSLPAADQRAGLWIHEPRPIMPHARQRVIPPRIDAERPEGRVLLQNVYTGRNMAGVQPGEIKRLLVLELLHEPVKTVRDWQQQLSWDGPQGGTFILERILGTVPVEPDGSAYFDLPAMRPIFFVALDDRNLSVKRMQSFLTVQPGESVSCVGCHEYRVDAPRPEARPLALQRAPSRVEPLAGIPDVFDFPRDIQPILDRHCVACHDYAATSRGGPRAGGVILAGDHGGFYSHSYASLRQFKQYADGRNGSGDFAPRAIGSSASPLMEKLDGRHYDVKLDPRETDLVRYWIESGAVYAGTYAALGTGMIGDLKPDPQVFQRRCAACHKQSLHGGYDDPRYHLYYNLSRPDMSLLLLAPLGASAGGYGTKCRGVFADKSDPDYVALLRQVEGYARRLAENPRFDMPGFRPTPHYLREMKFYGILPNDYRDGDPLDVYQIDRHYWQSLR